MPPARATLNVVSCSDVASLSSLLKLDVLDKDAMGRNQILGSAEFPVANLALHPKVHGAPRPLAPRSRMARACLACLQSDTWYPLVGDGVPDGAAIRVGFDFAKPRSVGCDGMHACRLAPRVSSRFVSVRFHSAGVLLSGHILVAVHHRRVPRRQVLGALMPSQVAERTLRLPRRSACPPKRPHCG